MDEGWHHRFKSSFRYWLLFPKAACVAVAPPNIYVKDLRVHPAALLLDQGALWGSSSSSTCGWQALLNLLFAFLIFPYLLRTILFLVIHKNHVSMIQFANTAVSPMSAMMSISRFSTCLEYKWRSLQFCTVIRRHQHAEESGTLWQSAKISAFFKLRVNDKA